ncbi:hypothetical protein CVT26_012210 [Gymnopilus dilepis]|uniref:Uncharacterized protein n=1 Tax=Gymnopilus dilepis TaxID=231916 RepID=A0A409YQ48_9AGAR|nr:hypothetical protein CVT26_012210 [Gymnopilus dilepis]
MVIGSSGLIPVRGVCSLFVFLLPGLTITYRVLNVG